MLLKSISMQRAGPGLAKARQQLEQSMAAGGKQAQEEEATNIIYSLQMFPYIALLRMPRYIFLQMFVQNILHTNTL